MRPANLGKTDVTNGSTDVGTQRVDEQIWMEGVRLEGWVREMAVLEWEASRV